MKSVRVRHIAAGVLVVIGLLDIALTVVVGAHGIGGYLDEFSVYANLVVGCALVRWGWEIAA